MNSLFKRNCFRLLINPFTYLSGLLLICFSVIHYLVTQNIFDLTGTTDLRSFFSSIPYVSILVIPALCACEGFSENEFNLPFSSYKTVLSKILSCFVFYSAFILLTLPLPLYLQNFGDLQYSQVLTGYTGIIIYGFSSISAAVFFFTLISNNALAFVSTALILAVINSCHLLPLYLNMSSIPAEIIKQFSFAWHFDAAGKGIIDTRDIIFYIVLTFIFYGLSVLVIEKAKGNKTQNFRKVIPAFTILLVLLFADGNRLYKRIDVTKNKQFTVTSYSKQLIKEIQEPVTITYYRSPVLNNLYPQIKDVRDFLEEYASQSSLIDFKLLDPMKNDAEKALNSYGIYGQVIDVSGNGSSASRVYSTVVISYLDRIETIPFVFNTSTLEFDISSRLDAMVRNVTRSVQIVTGNGLSLSEDYYYVNPWLQSMGFNTIETCLPSEKAEHKNMLSFDQLPEVTLLVLGTSYFSSEDVKALDSFIKKGGKAFISTTPYQVNYADDWSVIPVTDNVIYYLETYGLYFKESLTADLSNFRITFYSDTSTSGQSLESDTEYVNYPLWPVLLPQTNALNGMNCFWPCAIETDEETANDSEAEINKYLLTSTKAWQVEKVKGKFETNPFAIPQTPEGNDRYSQYVVAAEVKLNNGNSGRLIVLGDQYCLTTAAFNYSSGETPDMRNLDFLSDSLLKLENQEEIISLKNRNYVNTSLYKGESLNMKNEKIKTYGAAVIFPSCVLLLVYICTVYARKKFNSAEAES